jgi:hypothetical protein
VTLLAYVPDLMDRSKVSSVAATTFVSRPADLVAAATGDDLVVVDLGRPGVLDVLPDLVATGARVLGFGSHVERTTLEEASAAGCQAMPRSQFFRSLDALLNP